ncbi:MAG: hypothetical protein DWQ34_12080 [Planctomycetota bacterium]|nr:MAG: hypothetical protein DWQ29_08785 [Planctomycetota bacterium]REJ92932.1 MAG: hypothetical protein DWQ34_12080 [Planctomycetota bacterium]REK26138.1 MAG: hypothetical protein DWQ41_10810 [Planctomycetota bacterium]REK33508.1 MAG: hypothetical protein DWQ45_15080 [Planctomycetota bacterium]
MPAGVVTCVGGSILQASLIVEFGIAMLFAPVVIAAALVFAVIARGWLVEIWTHRAQIENCVSNLTARSPDGAIESTLEAILDEAIRSS